MVKHPVLVWLVEQLKAQGFKPAVVSRGLWGEIRPISFIVAENSRPVAGDEPVLIYHRTGVPLPRSSRSDDAVKALVSANDLDIIITDDGLQHYALQRDYEIVVIDGQRRFGNGWWLPRRADERAHRLDSVGCGYCQWW